MHAQKQKPRERLLFLCYPRFAVFFFLVASIAFFAARRFLVFGVFFGFFFGLTPWDPLFHAIRV